MIRTGDLSGISRRRRDAGDVARNPIDEDRATPRAIKAMRRAIERLMRRVEAAARPRRVSLPDLFPDGFMRRHTRFGTLQAFFDAAPVQFDTAEEAGDYLAGGPAEWDAHVAAGTDFSIWREMMKAAGAEEIRRRLNRI